MILASGTNSCNVTDLKADAYILKIETIKESFTQRVFVLDRNNLKNNFY
jgi:hypothetical protein